MLPGITGLAGLILGTEDPNVTRVHTSSSASEVAQYGADIPGRWIAILALGGDAGSPYNLSATISGAAGTVIKRHSSGDGFSTATGTAIIVGQPSGSSGTVTVSSGGGTADMRFYVLRVIGYDLSAAVFSDDSSGAGIPPWSANEPANGLALSVVQNSNLNAITWTGITEQIADAVRITGKNSSAAWDVDTAADAAKAVNVTHLDSDGQTSAVIATFNPL